MSKYIKKFETQAAYQAAQPSLERPNVSLIEEGRVIGYNPFVPTPVVETRVVCVVNVETTEEATQILSTYWGKQDYEQVEECFSAMEIDGVELPEVVPSYVFNTTGNHLVKLTLSDETTIVDCAFYISKIKDIIIPDSVTSIGYGAAYFCEALTSITIPDSVTSIGGSAFRYCHALSNITIPDSVTSISGSAFEYCHALSGVTVMATTPPTLGVDVFSGTNNCPIYVPAGSVDAYKAAENWSTYASRIQAISD